MSKINPNFNIEYSLIKGELNSGRNLKQKISREKITPINLNYYSSCPISRASETMAKCRSVMFKKTGVKN